MRKGCISIIILCICIIQIFVGCNKNYNADKILRTSSSITNYISDNLEQYKDRILKETGIEPEIIEVNNHGKDERYINFNLDDTTVIRLKINSSVTEVIKLFNQEDEKKLKK